MKTVKPLLTIGAAFLINTITQYIVEATTNKLSFKNVNGVEVTLLQDEVAALGKISLPKAAIPTAVDQGNLAEVNKALAVEGDAWLAELITVLRKNDALSAVNEPEDLNTEEMNHIKTAFGKATKPQPWVDGVAKYIGLNDTQLKRFAAVNLNATQLAQFPEAFKQLTGTEMVTGDRLTNGSKELLTENQKTAWNKIGLMMDAKLKQLTADAWIKLNTEAKAATGAASGVCFSSAVMLAPLAAWFLF